jgi:hypothetical protein
MQVDFTEKNGCWTMRVRLSNNPYFKPNQLPGLLKEDFVQGKGGSKQFIGYGVSET